ncbi:MAG TPA: polymer-forming cytoskeletal protein [Acidimicrobiia bacterium]
MRCRVLAATAVVFVFVLATAHPAGAQDGGGDQEHGRRINVTGGLVVAPGESIRGPAISANGVARIDGRVNGAVYVGRGDLLIAGRVTGDALVLDGDAFISGRVDGSVTVLNGKATVLRGADIRGDVASRKAPTAARGAVRGHVEKLDINSLFAGFIVVILAVLWLTVTVSTAALGLVFVWLFPRAADAVVVAGRRAWTSFFLGLFFGVLGPILGVVVIASVVGIPLGVAILGTLAVLFPLGYVASALIFGRLMVHGSGTKGRLGAFFAGFGILRFGALVPGLGFVIGFFASTYGFGAVILAGWRAARRDFGADELQPEYAGTPPPAQEEPPWAIYLRRPITQTTRARKAGTRKAPAKKRATLAKAGGTKSRTATARKTGPRKKAAKAAKKRSPAGANSAGRTNRAKKTTTKRPARANAAKKTTERPERATTAKKRSAGAKRTTKKGTAANKSRASNKRTTKKSAAKRRGSRKVPARKARPSKARAR